MAASKHGGLWIGTSHGLCYFDGKIATNYTSESLLPNPYVKLCFEARNGEVYVEDGERNLSIIASGRLLSRLTSSVWTSAIAEDAQSVLVAAGSGDCLFRMQDGKMNHYQYKDGAPPDYYWINNLFIANDGAIWVASKNGIFGRFYIRARVMEELEFAFRNGGNLADLDMIVVGNYLSAAFHQMALEPGILCNSQRDAHLA